MSEPLEQIRPALDQIEARWDDPRTERTLAAMHQRRAARRRRGVALGAGAVLALAAGASVMVASRAPQAADSQPVAAGAAPAPEPAVRRVDFADGSHVVLLDAAASIVVDAVSPAALAVRMPAGTARFEVVPNADRAFEVSAGEVVVQVLGTSFELIRDGARTHVQVLRGRVAVRWGAASTELTAGESGWFPRSARPMTAAEQSARADAAATTGSTPRKRTGAASGGWREHAEEGDFGRAYELLQRAEQRVADDVEELLLAADAARLSGHPAQAVPFLRRVIDRHDGDPRASLAAFTLGGVLMNQLGRPREAEAAYARARSLTLSAALAQDAVARQVEAAHRAGDTARARSLALEYLERSPTGRRVNAVRRFGGLE